MLGRWGRIWGSAERVSAATAASDGLERSDGFWAGFDEDEGPGADDDDCVGDCRFGERGSLCTPPPFLEKAKSKRFLCGIVMCDVETLLDG